MHFRRQRSGKRAQSGGLIMDSAVYAVEATIEETHWWFVGRRRLFADELRRAGVPTDARALDIGTGTGANLRLLRDIGFSNVMGLDASDEAIRFCAEKQLGEVRKGDICALPFGDASFDVVFATDVIEHIDDDERAAQEICRVLRPGGSAIITVPAFPSLWGLQDRKSFHKRRYRMQPLLALLRRAELIPQRSYYFNYILFAPIFLARRLIDLLRIDLQSEGQVNSPFLNRLMSALFTADIRTAPVLRPPFGASILVVASKNG
jgi:SAM-dependent methyltransferase